MLIRWLLAAVHLLALGVGLGAIWARARALRATLDQSGVARVLYADAWWGIAALLWISTGLVRAFGGFEKGAYYYLHNDFFLVKMVLLGAILVLEIGPMMTLMRWRARLKRGQMVDTSAARTLARTSLLQAGMICLMVLAAAAMARGYTL